MNIEKHGPVFSPTCSTMKILAWFHTFHVPFAFIICGIAGKEKGHLVVLMLGCMIESIHCQFTYYKNKKIDPHLMRLKIKLFA